MSDLRKAAQQALEALEYDGLLKKRQAITALRDALAQEQTNGSWHDGLLEGQLRERERWLAQQPEPVQEPVAKVELMTAGGNAGLATRIVEIDDHLRERLRPGQLLYAAPQPQRPPLTDEEIRAHADKHLRYQPQSYEASGVFDLVRAIERKVRGE